MMRIYVRTGTSKRTAHNFSGNTLAHIDAMDKHRLAKGHEVRLRLPSGAHISVKLETRRPQTRETLKAIKPASARNDRPRLSIVSVGDDKVETKTTIPYSVVMGGKLSLHFPPSSRTARLEAAS